MNTFIVELLFFITLVTSKRFLLKTNHTRQNPNDAKIHGGSYVRDIRKYPYMVSIMIHRSHQCGGALLTLKFVVTACRCLADVPEDRMGQAKPMSYFRMTEHNFVAGTLNINVFDSHHQIRKAKYIYIHPYCQTIRSLIYDHAMAKMRAPFRETPFVKPVRMYTWRGREFRRHFEKMFGKRENPKCEVSGWGDARRGVNIPTYVSPRLKTVKMYVLSDQDCSKTWTALLPKQFSYFSFWLHGEICAVSEDLDESDCAGDSGSPFVCDGHLVATVSYGDSSCASNHPSVYATMVKLLEWLEDAAFAREIDMTKFDLKPKSRAESLANRSAFEQQHCTSVYPTVHPKRYSLSQKLLPTDLLHILVFLLMTITHV